MANDDSVSRNRRSGSVILGRLLLALVAFAVTVSRATANEILDLLVQQGVELGPNESIKLPKPILEGGSKPAEQKRAIESLLSGRYDWDNFTRKSVVSPFLLKISDGEPVSGQVGRRVDLYFVAYGSLRTLAGDDYLHGQLDLAATNERDKDGGRVKVLSSDDLRKRDIPSGQGAADPRWIAVTSTLLGKVRFSLTTKNLKTQTDDSIVIATIADRQFGEDAEFPNNWQSITIDDAGRRQMGKPQPFSGLGSYVKATTLTEPAGAMFIEYHVAFSEPREWFHGANLLRSKLPIVVQDMVRKFRRSFSD